MPFLITGDPGARLHFLASWLQDQLEKGQFEVKLSPEKIGFVKLHTDWNNIQVKDFPGRKIRIKTSYRMLDLHLYLFLVKNVYPQMPDFNKDQYSLDVMSKMISEAKHWFTHDQQVNNDLYDQVLEFANTFDEDYLIYLYKWFNGTNPSPRQIEILRNVNDLNAISVPKNHGCKIAALILKKEHELGLLETDRLWSVVDVYQTQDQDTLYQAINELICRDNYRHGETNERMHTHEKSL